MSLKKVRQLQQKKIDRGRAIDASDSALTTVHVRATEIGQRAGSLLMQSLVGVSSAQRIVDLGFAIFERASA